MRLLKNVLNKHVRLLTRLYGMAAVSSTTADAYVSPCTDAYCHCHADHIFMLPWLIHMNNVKSALIMYNHMQLICLRIIFIISIFLYCYTVYSNWCAHYVFYQGLIDKPLIILLWIRTKNTLLTPVCTFLVNVCNHVVVKFLPSGTDMLQNIFIWYSIEIYHS